MLLFLLISKNGHKAEIKGKSRFGGIFFRIEDFAGLSAAKFFKALRRLFLGLGRRRQKLNKI